MSQEVGETKHKGLILNSMNKNKILGFHACDDSSYSEF